MGVECCRNISQDKGAGELMLKGADASKGGRRKVVASPDAETLTKMSKSKTIMRKADRPFVLTKSETDAVHITAGLFIRENQVGLGHCYEYVQKLGQGSMLGNPRRQLRDRIQGHTQSDEGSPRHQADQTERGAQREGGGPNERNHDSQEAGNLWGRCLGPS